jgi:hypothetical protein
MKLLLAALLLTACGQFDGADGQNGSSCTTRNDSVGVYVECSDGTDSFIPFPADGEKGDKGDSGSDGVNGSGCLLVEKNVTCRNHTRKADQYLKCANGEVFLKQTKLVSGC